MKPLKPAILILIAFFINLSLFSQELNQGQAGQDLREIAKKATARWNLELSLTARQARLMEKKILKFEMQKEELLNSKMNEEAKKERLTALQTREVNEFRNILTAPQFEKYMAVKSQNLKPGMDKTEKKPKKDNNRKH